MKNISKHWFQKSSAPFPKTSIAIANPSTCAPWNSRCAWAQSRLQPIVWSCPGTSPLSPPWRQTQSPVPKWSRLSQQQTCPRKSLPLPRPQLLRWEKFFYFLRIELESLKMFPKRFVPVGPFYPFVYPKLPSVLPWLLNFLNFFRLLNHFFPVYFFTIFSFPEICTVLQI